MDFNAAKAFLDALDHDGPFVFQTFDDSPEKRRDLAHMLFRSPGQAFGGIRHDGAIYGGIFGELAELNEKGAGIFVTINRAIDGRKIENVKGLRALFVDADGVPQPARWHIQPDMLVHRDATHWHAYWLLLGEQPLSAFKDAQKRLAAFYGTDPKINDLPRVMRVPGFLHRKGEPIPVQLEVSERIERRAIVEVLAGVPELPAEPVAQPAPVPPKEQRAQRAPSSGLSDLERAERYLGAVAGAGEGSRNQKLYSTGLDVLERFPLQESEFTALMLTWAARCSPPLAESEARQTIKQSWKNAHAKGIVGAKWRELKGVGGGSKNKGYEGSPDSDFETEVELPEEPVSTAADSLRTPSEEPPPSDPVGGGSREGVESSDQAAAVKWLNEEFESELAKAAALHGTERDAVVLQLFARIVDAYSCDAVSTITKARIRETLKKRLDLTKQDIEQAIREKRAERRADDGDTFDWCSLARQYISELGQRRALKRWRERWYLWSADNSDGLVAGAYTLKSDEYMEAQTVAWLSAHGVLVTTTSVANFLKNLKGLVFLDDDIEPPRWLCKCDGERVREDGVYASMANGIVDLDNPTRKPMAHTPHYWTLNALPYPYDPKATCPQFEEAILQWQPPVINEDTGVAETLGADLLRDWAAYCLLPGNPEQVFMLNIGEGRDGKSQYTEVLRALVGAKNCGSVGLEAFDPRKDFGLEPLLGKTLNITGDANVVGQMSEGIFKQITGGDMTSVNRKNKSALDVLLPCKFVINSNQLPYFRDRTDALWRRLLLLYWKQIAMDKVVKNFAKKLIAEEISGIFNWVLAALPRVRQRGFVRLGYLQKFVESAREETQHEIKFFDECVTFRIDADPDRNFVWTSKLVDVYREWCNENNCNPVLYGDNLGVALRKWLRRRLLAGDFQGAGQRLSEEQIEELLTKNLRKRATAGRRRWKYIGVQIATDQDRERSEADVRAGQSQLSWSGVEAGQV